VIRVAAEWPGGMSGGPVFNEAGHVIGVVSSGIAGGVGTATFFSGWNIPERIMGSIDPDNPGRFLCHGVFDEAGDLVLAAQDAQEAKRFAEARALTDHSVVSVDPSREGWMRLNRQW
jgi:serine protease Do